MPLYEPVFIYSLKYVIQYKHYPTGNIFVLPPKEPDLEQTQSEDAVEDAPCWKGFISSFYSGLICNSEKKRFPELTLQSSFSLFIGGYLKDFHSPSLTMCHPSLSPQQYWNGALCLWHQRQKYPTSRSSRATFLELWHNNLLTAKHREGWEMSVTLQSLCRGWEKPCDVRNIHRLHYLQDVFT